MGGEILQRMRAALGAQRIDHALGDGTSIKALGAVLGDAAQGLGQRRLAMDVAGARRFAAGQVDRGGGRIAPQLGFGPLPVPGHARLHGKALGRATDRRSQHIGQGLAAVLGYQPSPGFDRAGDSHGMGRSVADRAQTLAAQMLDR